jgi:Trypsin-like serine proteases, typically periplasmic, contain C-terminal PDZ domain
MRAFVVVTGLVVGCALAEIDTGDALRATVTIQTPRGGGSGFLAEFDGRTFIVTNQHVVQGVAARDVRISFSDGQPCRPFAAEVATGGPLDLIRLEVKADRKPLQISARTVKVGDAVCAVGNSLAAGVITASEGKVLGAGALDIETDCEFVPGNSGGPLIDAEGHVIGTPTRLLFGDRSGLSKGTRYEKPRRFSTAIRPEQKWLPVRDWKDFMTVSAEIAAAFDFQREVGEIMQRLVIGGNLESLEPSDPRVGEAISAFARLLQRFNKMSGARPTAADAQRNNTILGQAYRTAFNKLCEASDTRISRLESLKVPPEWGWLVAEKQRAEEEMRAMRKYLDQESEKTPAFFRN